MSMDCESAQHWIQARFDRELDVEHALELGGHLALCPECRKLAADLEQLCAVVRALPEPNSAGNLAQTALAQLNAGGRPSARNIAPVSAHFGWRIAGVLAGAAALVALVLYLRPRATPVATTVVQEVVVTPPNVVPTPESKPALPQSGPDLLKALIAQHYLAESRKPEAERRREKERAELLRDLHYIKRAHVAASRLLAKEPDSATVWTLAASVADPATGGEIFAAAAELKPDLRLVPIYIAALDSTRTRARATELLCSASGKRLGAQKELWMAWWAAARSQVRDD